MAVEVNARLANTPLPPLSRPWTIVPFGTSLEGQQYDGTLNGQEARGYFTFFNVMAGRPFKVLTNAGVSGNTSAQMLARIYTDVLAQYPGWCLVGAPVNDPANTIGYATTIDNMTAIWSTLLGAGINIIIVTAIPQDAWNAATVAGATAREWQSQYNNAARNYAATHKGCYLFDFARAITDPATGIALTGTLGDTVHPIYKAGMLGGRALNDVMSPILPALDYGISSKFDTLLYSANPQAVGDNADGALGFALGTGITGQGPNGWTTGRRATGAAVASVVARSASWKPDQFAQLAITSNADRDGAGWYVGGNEVLAKGRWDQAWAATTAYTYGDKKKPTVANGFHYFVVTPGTTGGSEPTWPTQAGQFVTDNGVVWQAVPTPVAGEQYFAECEFETSGLTANKGAVLMMRLDFIDTTATARATAVDNSFDLSAGVPAQWLPPSGKLRTGLLTIPNLTSFPIRYLRTTAFGYADSGGSFNFKVANCGIKKYVSTGVAA